MAVALPTLLLSGLGLTAAGCFTSEDPDQVIPPPDIQIAAKPPPPISGGTMIVLKNGLAVAADSDRDRVWVVDLANNALVGKIQLEDNDEPGRVAEDAAGRVHVALRRGGAVVTIDPASLSVVARRPVCPSPRGIAYDEAKDAIHVACEGGELVSLPATGAQELRRLTLTRDLRDVIVDGDRLLVSRFRAADMLVVDADGSFQPTAKLPIFEPNDFTGNQYEANVAWRTLPMKHGALMLHQRSLKTNVVLSPGGYYSSAGCDGNIVHAALSVIRSPWGTPGPDEQSGSVAIPAATLPVDAAISPDGTQVALVAAGKDLLFVVPFGDVEGQAGTGSCSSTSQPISIPGGPVSVAWSKASVPVVMTRSPAAIWNNGHMIALESGPEDSVADTAHAMFHTPPGFGAISCASCHPEGHEDGHTWTFTDLGARRTQNIGIGGGLMETAPFHWSGDLSNMNALMAEVFVLRMGGQAPGPRHVFQFQRWLDQLPALAPSSSVDAAAAARGKDLFNDKKVACASCHNGPHMTNNQSFDVGTGDKFQVPSLIGVAGRTPLMHTGCAATLHDRFDPTCGGGEAHGHTADLTPAQIDDLVAYLETL